MAARPLVLVPGACLGGWAWQEVARLLRRAGHDVYPVTLTGLGDRAHLAGPAVDLDTHVTDIVNLLDYERLDRAVLVGHSYAGTVVTAVADRRPERLDTVVYLDTGPLPDGTAIVDVQSPAQRELQQSTLADGWLWPVPDRQTLETGIFGSVAGLTDADFQLLADRGTPHPFATFTQPVRLNAGPDPRIRRAAILCSDGGMSLAAVRALIAAGDPRAATFAADDWELRELPTGHWSMLSLPEPLAALLHELAAPAGRGQHEKPDGTPPDPLTTAARLTPN
ncbi:MAG TPA: alpha/beta hydrolase [Solirubrobacteraceae bacterium]|nr:alpha/beta hydrolase [Solirubrobacteraceae bacterium]